MDTSFAVLASDNAATIMMISFTLIIATLLYYIIVARYYYGEPNEWVLVISSGSLKACGIGLQGIRRVGETVVKFPSTINKVSFTAEQVTKEMQGIRVTGFLIWSIFREGDGPFKAYKMLNNISQSPEYANESVARMAESIVRHNVANLTIQEVITQRHQIRDAMRQEMLDVVRGWGVWLETVEITDVYVLSKSLFENLQTEYRQAALKDAEKVKAQTSREIQEKQMEVKTALAMEEAESSTKTTVCRAQQKLVQAQEEQKLAIERMRIQEAQMEREKTLEMAKRRNDAEVRRLELDEQDKVLRAELAAEAERVDLQRAVESKQLSLKEMNEESAIGLLDKRLSVQSKHMQLQQLETVKKVYERVKEVRVVNIGGGGGGGDGGSSDQLIARVMASIRATDTAIAQ